jgi:two-component system KDP operon response regulator KdpE
MMMRAIALSKESGAAGEYPYGVLICRAGKVLTHRFLLKELWDELTDAQYLRVYVRQLRQKIEADPERPQFVLSETGIGYRLRAAD